jgi:hypothetical protein
MGILDCLKANANTLKWEAFCGCASIFVFYNNAGMATHFGYPIVVAFLWYYSDGKADVNLMVTFCRFFITGEITPDTAIVKIIGMNLGNFAGSFFSTLMGNYGGTSWTRRLEADFPPLERRLNADSNLFIGDALSLELTTLMYEGIGTGLFLLLFFAAAKMPSREASAVGYFLALFAFYPAFTCNPARTIAPMIVKVMDGGELPTNFWAVWLGPVLGVPFFGLFEWLLTGNMPAMFKICCKICPAKCQPKDAAAGEA